LHRAELSTLPVCDPKDDFVSGINTIIPREPKPWVGIANTTKMLSDI